MNNRNGVHDNRASEGQIEEQAHLADAHRRGLERVAGGGWRPFAPPGPLSKKLKSKLSQEAASLFEAWQRAEVYIRELAQEHVELEQRHKDAHRDLERAQAREVASMGKDRALPAAERLAAVETEVKARTGVSGVSFTERAREQAQGAMEVYRDFLAAHWRALVEEHKADAERVNKAYGEAFAKFTEATASLLDEHDEITQSLRHVLGGTEPFLEGDLPVTTRETSGYERVAMPSPESLERRQKFEVAAAEERRAQAERQRRQQSGQPERYRSLTQQREHAEEVAAAA